ncbi:hypothetical protein [Isoptericola sp. QY 916]|uniref:hypothetical protein n=1 Tax=Isoptericola sp. QY 916 TaxID=2782570 RepID=UPI003D3000C0|nr:hypothetical protein [Isoptericola sp. QY 916]
MDPAFSEAMTIAEASARMFAMTDVKDAGSRGPRRSLLALSSALGLEVDSNAVNAVVGAQIAEALGVEWIESWHYHQYQITLEGMNNLLWAASRNLRQLSRQSQVDDLDALAQVLHAFPTFKPAKGKQEGVDRLQDLIGKPRYKLGPGGKEYAATLEDLADYFAPEIRKAATNKHALAQALCREFGVPWTRKAVSTAGTVTKQGLNMILAGAERRTGTKSAAWMTAEEEGRALVAELARKLPTRWDGRESVRWMRENGSTKWFGSEWFGWYFEEFSRAILNEKFPTPPVGAPRTKYGETLFDYASPTRVWDMKGHSILSRDVPPTGKRPTEITGDFWLNDAAAMRDCIDEQGLGFLIVDGLSDRDLSGNFHSWLYAYGANYGKKKTSYKPSTGKSRPRKAAWSPMLLRAIWIQNIHEMNAGIAAGWLKEEPQWSYGAEKKERNPKFQGKLEKAGPWIVAAHEWPDPRDSRYVPPTESHSGDGFPVQGSLGLD